MRPVEQLVAAASYRGDDRPARKTVPETEAEAVASVVARAAGLDAGAAARDYIRRHDGNPIRRPAHPPLRVADR
ncbi:MAG: hypothetical protein HUU22_04100 [Phycisphaerae bacterium]|nr:hypothetical protein [Phycisphaerae bacterium]